MVVDSWGLVGKRALVTGASSGLGAHFAATLAAAGATVVLAARRKQALDGLARRIRDIGGACETVALDVADSGSIAALTDRIVPVDILINNAGITIDRPAIDQSEADWDSVLNTNLKGMFLLAQAVARTMIARGSGGSIVNIASILGLRQAGNVLSYAVSKAGAIQLTKTLALEWARHRISVNALAPGYIETPLNAEFWDSDAGRAMLNRIPQRRLGALADLETPLLLLASDRSAYMTGSVLTVDGGHLLSSL